MKRDTQHVIIAEDEVIVALSLAHDLNSAGFRVTVTHNGLQAREADAQDAADILLTDLQMPHLGGLDLIRCLRARRPMLPVIIITGRTPSSSAFHDTLGPTLCIAKPISDRDLLRGLRAMLVWCTDAAVARSDAVRDRRRVHC
ncbi:response regulator [Azospirillum argentinense]